MKRERERATERQSDSATERVLCSWVRQGLYGTFRVAISMSTSSLTTYIHTYMHICLSVCLCIHDVAARSFLCGIVWRHVKGADQELANPRMHAKVGVSENRGPYPSTLNSRIPIIRTPR